MSQEIPVATTANKALRVNLDLSRYGTFAEIGAGQEVARHFFLAGKASQTIAKSMSAYDMTFSDEIYGREKSGRYVCESRLVKMLEKEYNLLLKRLEEKRGKETAFFAFANTVATGSAESPRCHGWMGLRFQAAPGEEPNDIVMHVRMRDHRRLQQQEALGVLGVNLVDSAFYGIDKVGDFIPRLVQNLREGQVFIDVIKVSGPRMAAFDNRLLNLELIRQNLAEAVLFSETGEILHISDALFGKALIVERGNFNPLNNMHVDVLEKGCARFTEDVKKLTSQKVDVLSALEIVLPPDTKMKDLPAISSRIDMANAQGLPMMVTRFKLYYQLKQFLHKYTPAPMALVMGAAHLEKVFDPQYYNHLEGGLLEGMGKLLDPTTRVYVYPHKTEKVCMTSQTFRPQGPHGLVYQYFMDQGWLIDLAECDDVDLSISSTELLKQIRRGEKGWEKSVPTAVAKVIRENRLY